MTVVNKDCSVCQRSPYARRAAARPILVAVAVLVAGCSSDSPGPCDFLEAVPDFEEASSTPRENRNAEITAMICSNGAFPDEALYGVLAEDLDAIISAYPHLERVYPYHRLSRPQNRLAMRVASPDDVDRIATSPEVACLAEALDGEVVTNPDDSRVSITTWKVLDFEALRPAVESALDVQVYNPSDVFQDDVFDPMEGRNLGDTVIWRQNSDRREWLFIDGMGDCPSGCTAEHGYWFQIEADGTPTLAAQWVSGFPEVIASEDPAGAGDWPQNGPAVADSPTWGCTRCGGAVYRNWEGGSRCLE